MKLACEECVKTDNHCCLADILLDPVEAIYLSCIGKKVGIETIVVWHPKHERKVVILPKDAKRGVDITSTPCAFLKEGKCAIYQDRPFVCRQYGTDYIRCRYECAGITTKEEISLLTRDKIEILDEEAIKVSESVKVFNETKIYGSK